MMRPRMSAVLRPIPPPASPPTLRIPDWPLPTYRYVPGLNPHPIKDPEGSMVDQPDPPAWDAATDWTSDRAYLHGCDLFDHRYLWEAHETWEGTWLQVPQDNPYRTLLQALIQVAASMLKRHMGQSGASRRLYSRSRTRLKTLLDQAGPSFMGLDLPELIARIDHHQQTGEWPTLPLAFPRP